MFFCTLQFFANASSENFLFKSVYDIDICQCTRLGFRKISRCAYLNHTCADMFIILQFCVAMMVFESNRFGPWKLLKVPEKYLVFRIE